MFIGLSVDEIVGCLLGGAVGDALGAPIEFLDLNAIRGRFGPQGLDEYTPAYGRLGAVTDDTQMTLFTAEGLIRAHNRWLDRGLASPPAVVYRAYLRWLDTQGEGETGRQWRGWLVDVPAIRNRRGPGNTCLSALTSGQAGTTERPLNDSKGCGGVMRIAPVGLIGANDPFRLGCDLAAITHGHPSGYLAAGFVARVLHEVSQSRGLDAAIDTARSELRDWPHHEECLSAVDAALTLASESGEPTAERVERLGAGWVAEGGAGHRPLLLARRGGRLPTRGSTGGEPLRRQR